MVRDVAVTSNKVARWDHNAKGPISKRYGNGLKA